MIASGRNARDSLQAAPVLFATGGSGGHIYPALAIAAGLRATGRDVVFCGQRGGMEDGLVTTGGYEFHGVKAGKLDRQRPDPRQLLASMQGVLQAVAVVRRVRPPLVLGFGGFASLPAAVAALLTGTPLLLHEQNAFPGLVSRLLGRYARLVVTSLPEAQQRMKAKRFTVIPYPVREDRVEKRAARRALGLPQEGLLTLVMGGSQGSAVLNEAVVSTLRGWDGPAPLTLHSTGSALLQQVLDTAGTIPGHMPHAYLDSALAWSAADLAITRAGTGTLSEAAFHGVPVIMVPLPTSAENHQLHNALAVESAGAGLLLPQAELQRLPEVWRALRQPGPLSDAAAAAASRSPAGARDAFVSLILQFLRVGRDAAQNVIKDVAQDRARRENQ